MGFVSSQVKVWKQPGVEIQREGTAPFNVKEGPYFELSKSEARELSASLLAELNEKVDWMKPDETLTIPPKYQPIKQIVKLASKK